MNINIKITKKHFYMLFSIIALIGVAIFVRAASLNVNQPWHPLQQVSTTSSSGLSIDDNADGSVDYSNFAQISSSSNNALGIQNKQVYWDSTNPNMLCYDISGSSCSNIQTPICNVYSGTLITTTDGGPEGCDTACYRSCVLKSACIGNSLCSANPSVYFTSGYGQLQSIGADRCDCSCTRPSTPARTYVTGTQVVSTRKCATFTDG